VSGSGSSLPVEDCHGYSINNLALLLLVTYSNLLPSVFEGGTSYCCGTSTPILFAASNDGFPSINGEPFSLINRNATTSLVAGSNSPKSSGNCASILSPRDLCLGDLIRRRVLNRFEIDSANAKTSNAMI